MPLLPFRRTFKGPTTRGRRILWTVLLSLAFLLLCILAFLGNLLLSTSITDVSLIIDGGPTQISSLPLHLTTENDTAMSVRLTILQNSVFSPTVFSTLVDDCLYGITVNGETLSDPTLPYCDFNHPTTVDLTPLLHFGSNDVLFSLFNNGGTAVFSLEPIQATAWSINGIIAVLLTLFLGLLLLLWRARPWVWHLAIVLGVAVFLRIHYVAMTPYWIRGHDTDGHIEYIAHIAQNWSLPSPDQGWEFWQPPLYYVLGAVWMNAGRALGLPPEANIGGLQTIALVLSLLTLGLIVWIGLLVIPKKEREYLPLLVALPALLPGIIFFAARINNDVIVAPLSFLALALLILWRKRGGMRWWLLFSLTAGLALLAKTSGSIVVAIGLLLLLLRKPFSLRSIAAHATILLCAVLVLNGWFWGHRYLRAPDQELLVGNIDVLNGGLRVPTTAFTLFSFNPAAVVRIPFNNPWDDASRRQYFLEYLYRSAFSGEFDLRQEKSLIASWSRALGLGVLLLACIGLALGIARKNLDALIMLVTALVTLLGHYVIRLVSPFSSTQDFRYSPLLILPIAWFAVEAIRRIHKPEVQRLLLLFCCFFLLLCVMEVG